MPAGDDHLPAPGSAFAISRRGYDATQVDDYLRHLDAQLRMLAADRDAAVEQNGQLTRQVNVAWAETDRLKGQLRRLSAPPESVEGMSERLQSMLRLAQDEVAERRRRAEAEAADIIARAEAAAAELPMRNEEERLRLEHERTALRLERDRALAEATAEAQRVRDEARAETDKLRAEVTAELERERIAAETGRNDLRDQSDAKRAQVEEDFRIAMTARRSEAIATIEQNLASSQNEARSRLSAATDRANQLVADATAKSGELIANAENQARNVIRSAEVRVAELDALRERMRSQLSALRGVLDEAVPGLARPTVTPGTSTDTTGTEQPGTPAGPARDGSASGSEEPAGSASQLTPEPRTGGRRHTSPRPVAAPTHGDRPDLPHASTPRPDAGSADERQSAETDAKTPGANGGKPRPSPRRRNPAPVGRQS
ncbi:hypothetical protein [Pseudonocardia sp.]|uniref:hypothetical protein n=1 Tax=Pseudonocardia sp. TaxID=60912 RepID=UPI0026295FE7|nr:hypothetical protein [Pseudonocardia sp.]